MAAHTTHKSGHAGKAATLAKRQARLAKRLPSAVVTRSGHVSVRATYAATSSLVTPIEVR